MLPPIVEVKRTITGKEKRFECAVLARRGGGGGAGEHLVVLYVAPTAMHVHGVDLAAGTVTFGHFWTARPYNVYHWLDPATGATIGAYVNLSAETHLDGDRLTWLDLVVDVLLLPGAPPRVLDEDEVPPDASTVLRAAIDAAKAAVLGDASALVAELEADRRALWPRFVAEVAATETAGGGGGPTTAT